MYDLDGDELISKNELLTILHMMVGTNISEEQVRTYENYKEKHKKIFKKKYIYVCAFGICM